MDNKDKAQALVVAAFAAQEAVGKLHQLVIGHREDAKAAAREIAAVEPNPGKATAFLAFLKTQCPHPPAGREGQTWQWMADAGGRGARTTALHRMLTAPGVAVADRFRAQFVLTVFYDYEPECFAGLVPPAAQQPVRELPPPVRPIKAERFEDFQGERCPFLAGDWKWVAQGVVGGGRHSAMVKYLETKPEGKHAERCRLALAKMVGAH